MNTDPRFNDFTLDNIIKKYPPKKEEDISETHFDSEEEEEEADFLFNMPLAEQKYYNEEGEWIGDDDNAVEEREKQLKEE